MNIQRLKEIREDNNLLQKDVAKILKIKQDSQINGNACRQSNVPCPLCFGKLQGIA